MAESRELVCSHMMDGPCRRIDCDVKLTCRNFYKNGLRYDRTKLIERREMRLLHIIILLAIVCSTSCAETENEDTEKAVEHEDRPELQECRKSNKGKWCTCRKLLKLVEKKIGKELGLYIPQCGRFKPKLFRPKQCSGARCWCVRPKSGRMVKGTLREDSEIASLKCDPPYNKE